MNYLESIFNNIDEALLIVTPAGELVYFNNEAEHIHEKLGIKLITSKNIFEIFPPEVSKRVSDAFQEVKKTKEILRVVSERKLDNGTTFFAEISYIPTVEDGTITHINILVRDVSVGKIFERKITGMATELRNLIDQANAVIIGTDTRGYITDWNRHTRALTGYTKNDAFTQKFTELLQAEVDRPEFDIIFQQVLDGAPKLNIEVPVLSKNGEKLFLSLSATARFNSTDQIIGVIFVGQDVTVQRKIEKELKFAHERLLFHLENAPLGFIEWNSKLEPTFWTRRAEEIFGWSEKDFIASGRTGYSQVYIEDQPWVNKIAEQLLSGELERNNIQHRNIRKDGTVIWCEWFNSVLKDSTGQVVAMMSLVQDITERKKNELSLKEAQLLAHLGNWEMDLRTKKVMWSEETFNILGFSINTDTPTLNAYLDTVHPDDREKVVSIISFTTQTFKPQSFYHRIIRHGVERSLFITSKYEFDTSQKPIRLYGTMMDVSNITEKERQLQQAVEELEAYKKTLEIKVQERTTELMLALKKEKDVVEMKSRFVSIASHEFRTPLSSIQHATNYIRKHKKWTTDNDLTSKLNDIERQSKHMMFLLDDVLTYGKSEAGKIQLVTSTIDLKEFLEKIIEDVGHTTKNTHAIRLSLNSSAEKFETDEKLLRNVLINLLTNAIKYSPGQQSVDLTVDSNQYTLNFIIRDSGIGIPVDEQDRIFEAFVRGRSVENIQGTGLGLSIVKKAVELLGGTIDLESEVGKGTVVTVAIRI
jgi:PAS domain S-box-containing protein